MKLLPRIVDCILLTALVFAVSFVWAQYYIRLNHLSWLFSAALSIAVLIICIIFMRRKTKKQSVSAIKKDKTETTLIQLLFMSEAETLKYFEKVLNAKSNNKYSIKDGYLQSGKTAVAIAFRHEALTLQSLTDIMSRICRQNHDNNSGTEQIENIIVLVNSVYPKAKEYISAVESPKVLIKEYDEVFKLLSETDIYPETFIKLKQTRSSARELFNIAFSRKRVKGYLFAAIMLLFSSWITPFPLYYLIFATIAASLAAVSLFNIRLKTPENSVEF